jgi:hypothetical protein
MDFAYQDAPTPVASFGSSVGIGPIGKRRGTEEWAIGNRAEPEGLGNFIEK